jgi:hypothetical protein
MGDCQPVRHDVAREAVVEPPLDTAPRAPLGEVLGASGVVSPELIADALAKKGDARLGEYLVRTGVVSEDIVAWAVAQQFGLPYIDLTKETPQPDAAAMITSDASHAFQILPMRMHPHGTLDVLVADPTDVLVHRVLESLPVRRVRLGMAPPSQMRSVIDAVFPVSRPVRRLRSLPSRINGFCAACVHTVSCPTRRRRASSPSIPAVVAARARCSCGNPAAIRAGARAISAAPAYSKCYP